MNNGKLKTHIDRMEQELKEISEKYGKLQDFLCSETIEKITNEKQREFLTNQSDYMYGYIEVLKERIEYDKNKK